MGRLKKKTTSPIKGSAPQVDRDYEPTTREAVEWPTYDREPSKPVKPAKTKKPVPVHIPLGKAPDYLDFFEASFWEVFRREMPWLTAADASFVEMACKLRAGIVAGTLPVEKWGNLRTVLVQMRGQATSVDKMSDARNGEQKGKATAPVASPDDELNKELFG